MAQVRALKRRADDSLESEPPPAKRFHRLNFENYDRSNLYIDLPIRQSTAVPAISPPAPPPSTTTATKQNDYMTVDPTPHKVFIHDLDAELESVTPSPSEEGNLVFLPEIEKHLQGIPRSILHNREEPRNDQLVLYEVPKSLSVPEEMDSVRKAIIDARARARKKTQNEQRELEERESEKRAEQERTMLAPSVYGYGTEDWKVDGLSCGFGEARDEGLWKGWMRENGTWGVGPMECDDVTYGMNGGVMWPDQSNLARIDDVMVDESGAAGEEAMDLG